MRRTAAEKYALIRLVEGSELPMRQTFAGTAPHSLHVLPVVSPLPPARARRSRVQTFGGPPVLEPDSARVRQRVVEAALADPERSPRELAWQLTDREGHFLSESSVYRILRAYDLMPSPAFIVLSAGKTFQHPTHRAERTLADRFYLSARRRLGLVLPVDGTG